MPDPLRSKVVLVVPKAPTNKRKSEKSMVREPSKSVRGSAGVKMAEPVMVRLIEALSGSFEIMSMVPVIGPSAGGLNVTVMS